MLYFFFKSNQLYVELKCFYIMQFEVGTMALIQGIITLAIQNVIEFYEAFKEIVHST